MLGHNLWLVEREKATYGWFHPLKWIEATLLCPSIENFINWTSISLELTNLVWYSQKGRKSKIFVLGIQFLNHLICWDAHLIHFQNACECKAVYVPTYKVYYTHVVQYFIAKTSSKWHMAPSAGGGRGTLVWVLVVHFIDQVLRPVVRFLLTTLLPPTTR